MANSAFAIEAGQYVVTVGGQYSWAGTPTVNNFGTIKNNDCPAGTTCGPLAPSTTISNTAPANLSGTSKLNLGGGYLGVGYGVADGWTVGAEFGMQTNKTFFNLQNVTQAQATASNGLITYGANGTNVMLLSGGFSQVPNSTTNATNAVTATYSALTMQMKSNYQVLLKGGYTYYFSDSMGGFASLGLGWGTSKLAINGTLQATTPAQTNALAVNYSKSRSSIKGMLEGGLIWKATDMFRVMGSVFVENRVKPKSFAFSVMQNTPTTGVPTALGFSAGNTGFSNKVGYGLRLGVGFVF